MTNDAAIKARKRSLQAFFRISDKIRQLHVDFNEPKVRGSCQWLALESSFRRWRDALEPRIFWLNGNPGTGKTFLAKFVAAHVCELGFGCSSFFFRSGATLHSSIAGCLLSLAWQMAEGDAAIREKLLEMHESDATFDPESFQSIWRTLFVGGILQIRLAKPHFWVLDGVDECSNYGELFPLLASISTTSRCRFSSPRN